MSTYLISCIYCLVSQTFSLSMSKNKNKKKVKKSFSGRPGADIFSYPVSRKHNFFWGWPNVDVMLGWPLNFLNVNVGIICKYILWKSFITSTGTSFQWVSHRKQSLSMISVSLCLVFKITPCHVNDTIFCNNFFEIFSFMTDLTVSFFEVVTISPSFS